MFARVPHSGLLLSAALVAAACSGGGVRSRPLRGAEGSWRYHAEIAHREVLDVVRDEHGPMRASGTGDERIRSVHRPAARGESSLVAARSLRRLPRRLKIAKPSEEVRGVGALRRTHAAHDFRDPDARDGEMVASPEDLEESSTH